LRDVQNGETAMKLTALIIMTATLTLFAVATAAETIDPAQAIAQKFSEATDEKPTAPRRTVARPGNDYETDMLARAREEERERRQQAPQTIAAQPASPRRTARPIALSATPIKGAAQVAALPEKPAPEPPAPKRPETTSPLPTISTVLLVLDPDGSGPGIKPDPIICIDNGCWLSSGITSPARRMSRNQAVALATTADLTADSCSGKSGCVYREVPIDPTARLDVIEVGEGGGASLGAYTIAADRTCRKQGDGLVCDNGIGTQGFRIWVVPEATAEAAGASALENAVAEGLADDDATLASDK
jgi:hypothetical protein